MLQNPIILVNTHLVVVHCNFSLSKGCFRRMGKVNPYTQEEPNIFNEILSCKDSNKNGELIMAWLKPEINLPILSKIFTFSTNTFKDVRPIRKDFFCIMYSWKCLGVDEVTSWFIKLILNFKTPSYPLIEYAVINNRFMRLSS